ncbi:Ankyrin repeat protein [Lasiodiplodia theobromae]|uniref:Ankyrin repeat protein n=1 Tax=Lasiodiplodia theobromae TaxID=45133 RepID=UPI0015C32B06|nr:Ankyrin repeat protein [Lasiodiplodia theobromae]KAF4545383.1 Ankyrin repeat protein [Lasiodiplodia theobromae]
MATRNEVLQACADQPPEAVLSLTQTCPDPPTEMQMAYKAAENGNSTLLHWLLHNATTPLPRGTLLLAAASALSQPCIQAVLDLGLDINLANDPDLIANDRIGGVIHRALRSPNCTEAFIAWLLERGADPNAVDAGWQRHVLVYAMTHGPDGSMPIVKLLIAYGADVNRAKALHYAASCNDIEKARFLVEEAGANVDEPGVPEKDFYWERGPGTPLHTAVARGHSRVAHYLLKKGADLDARDAIKGMTPLEVAEDRWGPPSILSILKIWRKKRQRDETGA